MQDQVKNMKFTKPLFRIFRSSKSNSLYAVHLVDKREDSICIMNDELSYEQAQDYMLEYSQLQNVVETETI